MAESNPRDAKDTPTSNPTESATLDPEARPFQPQNTALLVGTKGAVLLQTASVHAYDPERPEHSMTVRAILDTGSQQSYVSQRVKDTLALKPSCKQTLSVMTFSSNDQKRQDCVWLPGMGKDKNLIIHGSLYMSTFDGSANRSMYNKVQAPR